MPLRAVVFDLNGVIVDDVSWHRGALQARPGIIELIEALDQAGVLLAVATSGRSVRARQALVELGLADRFAAVVGMEDAGRPKPDPAPYRLALQRLGVAAADAVAIDDSPAGVRSARSAGLAVVALPAEGSLRWGFGNAHLVTDSPADLDITLLEMLAQSPRA